jgi:hypothetical protein
MQCDPIIGFNRVLEDVATFYVQVMQAYQSNYGIGTVSFTNNLDARQIQIGVSIPSQHNLIVLVTLACQSGQWFADGMHVPISDMLALKPILHQLFRRVHLGTVKVLEFLESRRVANNWYVSYDRCNIIRIEGMGVEWAIYMAQNTFITNTEANGIFEANTHRTRFTSLDDIKALMNDTNSLMDC